MKWVIIILIMMSLVGSMMWVMPSKRQRFQAELRRQASQKGFNVQIVRLTPPRGIGQIEPETYMATAYRLPRFNLEKGERESFREWQVYKQEAIANEGLPAGWCWGAGERQMDDTQLGLLAELIGMMPEGVNSIESTPVHFSVFWDERGQIETLDQFKTQMQKIVDNKF
ncbi:MAG: hypothetical protein V7731_12510 [Amphritea sp.]